MKIRIACAALCLTALLFADGGAIELRRKTESLLITVFGEPSPLRAGVADLSVFVQNEASGRAVLDAQVALRLSRMGEKPIYAVATRAQATNKLLYSAKPLLTSAGEWGLNVKVMAEGKAAAIDGVITVLPRQPSVVKYWVYIALAPAGMLLFLVNQWLKARSRERVDSRSPRGVLGSDFRAR